MKATDLSVGANYCYYYFEVVCTVSMVAVVAAATIFAKGATVAGDAAAIAIDAAKISTIAIVATTTTTTTTTNVVGTILRKFNFLKAATNAIKHVNANFAVAAEAVKTTNATTTLNIATTTAKTDFE